MPQQKIWWHSFGRKTKNCWQNRRNFQRKQKKTFSSWSVEAPDESGTRQLHVLCAELRKLSLVSAVLRSLQATSLTRGVSNSVTLAFLARISSTSKNTKYWNTQPNWFSWAPHGGGAPVHFTALLPPWPDTEGHHSFLPQSGLQFLYDRGSNCTLSAASSHQRFSNSWLQSFDTKLWLLCFYSDLSFI